MSRLPFSPVLNKKLSLVTQPPTAEGGTVTGVSCFFSSCGRQKAGGFALFTVAPPAPGPKSRSRQIFVNKGMNECQGVSLLLKRREPAMSGAATSREHSVAWIKPCLKADVSGSFSYRNQYITSRKPGSVSFLSLVIMSLNWYRKGRLKAHTLL